MQRIKEGDLVEVIAGEDKGLRGTVQQVFPGENRVVVSGINIVKKHQRSQPTAGRQAQGGIIEFEAPINVSKVMLVCPDTDEPTRIGFRVNEEGEKVRYSKKSGQDID